MKYPKPADGDTWTVRPDGRISFRRQLKDPYLYHHKWLMVADDYTGFDVAESKARSAQWAALPGLDRSRIGRRSFWQAALARLTGETP